MSNAWEVTWTMPGDECQAPETDTLIVVAATATKAVERLAQFHDYDLSPEVDCVVRCKVDVVESPAPPPALPKRVLVLRRTNPYPDQTGALAVGTSRANLARFIGPGDREAFLAGETRGLWEIAGELSQRDPKTGLCYSCYCALDECETV